MRHRRPNPPRRGEPISADLLRQITNAVCQRILVSGGGQVRRVGTNLVIQQKKTAIGLVPHLAEVYEYVDQGNNQNRYGHRQVDLNADDTYTVRVDGYAGRATSTDDYALNGFEAFNDGVSPEGGGIDTDTYDVLPVSGNPVVVMWRWPIADGARRFFFSDPNLCVCQE